MQFGSLHITHLPSSCLSRRTQLFHGPSVMSASVVLISKIAENSKTDTLKINWYILSCIKMALATLIKATGRHCKCLASGDRDAQSTSPSPKQGCSDSAGGFCSPRAAPWGWCLCVMCHSNSSLISVLSFQYGKQNSSAFSFHRIVACLSLALFLPFEQKNAFTVIRALRQVELIRAIFSNWHFLCPC